MTWAYDFECDMPILGILAALNQAGPWRWIERDKEAFGTYIWSVPFEGVHARLYSDPHSYGENGPRYTADFQTGPGCETSRQAIEAPFRDMLVLLSARKVAPGEYWD
jgi:hypothetical protein